MKQLYVIAGCNGAGKTTASYTVLPDILECKEFVNADEIAKGLSPFNPENVALTSGRLMLERIKKLTDTGQSFAFETTLSTRSYRKFIVDAKKKGYSVTLLFFYLNSADLAVERVKTRVVEGGHNIPENVIRRRYVNGLKNFFELYCDEVHNWMFIENSGGEYLVIAEREEDSLAIHEIELWQEIKTKYS
jgi:predicted ABC-type ATPase